MTCHPDSKKKKPINDTNLLVFFFSRVLISIVVKSNFVVEYTVVAAH